MDKKVCPIMKNLNLPEKICNCDVPEGLRPKGICHQNNECLADRKSITRLVKEYHASVTVPRTV
jgi:hypothetical protein